MTQADIDRNEIIDIYKEVSNKLCNGTEWCWAGVGEPLQLFAKLVDAKATAREREACAKVAICYDSEPWKHTPAYSHVADMVSVEIGKAIRARGQQ